MDTIEIQSAYKSSLIIGTIEIPCYVLDNGQRVLSRSEMQRALGYTGSSGSWLIGFLNSSSLKEYVPETILQTLNNPIKIKRNGAAGSQAMTYGYDVTFLVDLCDLIVEAGNNGLLPEKHMKYVEVSYNIIRAVAKIGISAIVEEGWHIRHEEQRNAIYGVLRSYISDDLLQWHKSFPDAFYIEIFRLNKWKFSVAGITRRPAVIGRWTNELIYKQLPKGVLDEIRSRTPGNFQEGYSKRFFQSLTNEIGHPALIAQIYKVIGIMNISENWDHFKINFNKMHNRNNGQTELNFDIIEKEMRSKKVMDLPFNIQTKLIFHPDNK